MKDAGKLVMLCALGLALSYLAWIIFVGTFSFHELLVGIIGAALATGGMLVVNLQYPARFSPKMGELLTLWRIPWYLLSGSWEIVMVAGKDLLGIKPAESLFRLCGFEAGQTDDPHDVARRVLAVSYTTATPNFIVLGVNTNSRKMLFHQIERSPVPKMTKELGAR